MPARIPVRNKKNSRQPELRVREQNLLATKMHRNFGRHRISQRCDQKKKEKIEKSLVRGDKIVSVGFNIRVRRTYMRDSIRGKAITFSRKNSTYFDFCTAAAEFRRHCYFTETTRRIDVNIHIHREKENKSCNVSLALSLSLLSPRRVVTVVGKLSLSFTSLRKPRRGCRPVRARTRAPAARM